MAHSMFDVFNCEELMWSKYALDVRNWMTTLVSLLYSYLASFYFTISWRWYALVLIGVLDRKHYTLRGIEMFGWLKIACFGTVIAWMFVSLFWSNEWNRDAIVIEGSLSVFKILRVGTEAFKRTFTNNHLSKLRALSPYWHIYLSFLTGSCFSCQQLVWWMNIIGCHISKSLFILKWLCLDSWQWRNTKRLVERFLLYS
jgi:hypothetical protein